MRKSTVKRRIIRRRRMDPHTAKPTKSSVREKISGQCGIIQTLPFCHTLVKPGLTCVVHAAWYLAFLLPVLGNNRICKFQESLQWAFMLTARDCQWEGFRPTLIPVKHLHREVTENETQHDGFFFPSSWSHPFPKTQCANPFLYSGDNFSSWESATVSNVAQPKNRA